MESLRIGLAVKVRGKRGVIKYVGKTRFAPGVWVGIELTEPSGKNNGSVNGVEYFSCSRPGNYGIFVSPALVEVAGAGSGNVSETSNNAASKTRSNSGRSTPSDSPSGLGNSSVTSPQSGTNNSPGNIQHYKLIIDRLQSKLQDSFKDIKQYKSQVQDLTAKLTEIEQLDSKLDELQVDRDYFKQENITLQENIRHLETRNDDLVKEINSIRQELELTKQIDAEINSLVTDDFSNDDIDTLITKNKTLQVTLQKLKNISMDKELSLLNELDELNSTLKNGITKEMYLEVTRKLTLSEETIQDLKAQLDSISDLEQIIEHLTSENEQLNVKISQLQLQLTELIELQELDKDLEEGHLQVENNLRQKIDSLQYKLIEETKKREDLQVKLNNLNNRLADVEAFSSEERIQPDLLLISSNLAKLLEISKLELKTKIRELDYSNLLLEISTNKLEILDNLQLLPNNLTLPVASLQPLLALVKRLSDNCDSFAEQFKLRLLYYHLELIFLVASEILSHDNSGNLKSAAEILNNEIESLLLNVKNHTLTEYKYDSLLSLITRLFADFMTSNRVFNKTAVLFLKYQVKMVSTFINLIEPFNVTQTEDLAAIVNEVSKKLNLTKFDEQDQNFSNRYNISIDRNSFMIIKILNLNGGNLNFENLEEIWNHDNLRFSEWMLEISQLIHDYLTELDKDFLPVYKADKLFIKQQVTPKEETKSVTAITNELLEKDKIITDLELTIELLSNNLKTASKTYQHKLENLNDELTNVKQSYNNLKVKYNTSVTENKYLKLETEKLLSTGKYFDLSFIAGKFDSLNLENSYSNNLKLIEENRYLRTLIKKTINDSNRNKRNESQDLRWLESEQTSDIGKSGIQSRIKKFNELSTHLQRISNSVEQVELPINSWKPKRQSPKFTSGAINEQFHKYKNECSSLLLS